MGRQRVPLDADDGKVLLVGYDRPFKTYYAMLYTREKDDVRLDDEPDKAIGYHPMERNPDEITEHGPYPCDMQQFTLWLQKWGLGEEEVIRAIRAAKQDPDAQGVQ